MKPSPAIMGNLVTALLMSPISGVVHLCKRTHIEIALRAALLVRAAAMLLRFGLDRRHGRTCRGIVHGILIRSLPTVHKRMIGGLTSVGSASLMIVLLLFVCPILAQTISWERARPKRCR
jgi:hypothetical protein